MTDLLAALRDEHPDARLTAALRLGEDPDSGYAAPLVGALVTEPDFQVRETLTWAVMRVGLPCVPHLTPHLADPDLRFRVLHALSKIGDASVVDDVAPYVGDVDDAVAAKAAWTLGRLGDPRGVRVLVSHLGSADAEHRNAVRTALASLGEEAVAAVATRLSDDEAAVRSHAAEILTYIGDPGAREAAPALARAVHDPDLDVRLGALTALAELDDDVARTSVRAATTDEDTRVRAYARHLEAAAAARRGAR